MGQGFFQTSHYIRAIFWKRIEHIYIYVIFFISCAIQCHHPSVFIFTVQRILSPQLWLNVLGHSLPTKLYIEPYILWITFIFDSCHRSWAAVTFVKYKRDIQKLTCVLTMLKNSENNGMEKIGLNVNNPRPWSVREITKSSSTFSATNISSNVTSILKLHDTILINLIFITKLSSIYLAKW